ncbi:MAG: hypothetical protein V1676_03725 [Candidatus Diapherotrites archaeon]
MSGHGDAHGGHAKESRAPPPPPKKGQDVVAWAGQGCSNMLNNFQKLMRKKFW